MNPAVPGDSRSFILRVLERDRPSFHFIGDGDIAQLRRIGFAIQTGEQNLAVAPAILSRIAEFIGPDDITLETGTGYTTVVCAALARHHYCIAPTRHETDKVGEYLRAIGVPPDRVTFFNGPSDRVLPVLEVEPVDFAYIDGCHGYPFPSLDWHYIDRLLRLGGILGMDNAELRPVRQHCQYLETPGSGYELVARVNEHGAANFYRKSETTHREWIHQPWSRALREPRRHHFKYRLRRYLSEKLRPYLY
jgi:predicted O-methyltransferase YrrM